MQPELLEAMGIEAAFVIVSCGVVYRASTDTNYNFVSGNSKILTPEQMLKNFKEGLETFKETSDENPDDYFETYYELTYHGETMKYTVTEYKELVDMLCHMQNMSAQYSINY